MAEDIKNNAHADEKEKIGFTVPEVVM